MCSLICWTPPIEQMPVELRKAIYSIGLKIADKEDNAKEQVKWQQKLQQLNP